MSDSLIMCITVRKCLQIFIIYGVLYNIYG